VQGSEGVSGFLVLTEIKMRSRSVGYINIEAVPPCVAV